MTRKSTPKYEVYHLASGTVVVSGISRTEATKIARQMPGCSVRFISNGATQMTELNNQAKTVRAERHHGSALWLIRSIKSGNILNSAMSYEWAVSSMKDWINFETRLGA